MSRPSRIRRIAKWSGVAVCVMNGAAWGISTTWGVSFFGSTMQFSAANGIIYLDYYGREVSQASVPRWQYGRTTGGLGLTWPLLILWSWGRSFVLKLPLWIPFLIVALPTAYLFWRDRRHPPGHCQKCGYDLQGNVSGVCPECGEPNGESATHGQ